ncbi:hypothetical protein N7468_006086 [Penicillium chermesinum]|uniref:Uncharacterized protein n=1 Tax=Penicillium chermesinum TaxID=63820 RepID=A0A9W9P124_9EURO|nr:uncharacterized protein N7468_006086 [Penicillium chermesinum]KAJ5233130.1 hypothetical protein N7468_006086 [Penicillium chermesinum]
MSDSTLYLYTSLTAGSSHIVTATARIETILKANKLPFRAIDVATDDAARKLWGRRSKGKKLPGLVKYGNIVGDLEEIEEWNEFGELRMVVNNVPDLDGMPATSNPIATPEPPAVSTPKEPEPGTPKPSTIKIQSPPPTKAEPEEKKDEKAVLALRQASTEAASKAKDKADDKQEGKTEPKGESPPSTVSQPRRSVAPELPDTAPDSPKALKRPPLVPEVAAVSTANFRADNAEAFGLVEHHRGSIVSATDPETQEKVHEIRESISSEKPGGALDALRQEAKERPQGDSIDSIVEAPELTVEDPLVSVEDPFATKEEAPDAAPGSPKETGKDSEATEAARSGKDSGKD